jgi:hypothetical protein
VDLLGEQTVQVMATVINAAIVLLMALLIMLLSVRLARLATGKPALARVPLHTTGRLVLPDRSDMPSELRLQRSLPTRGPPGSVLCGLTSSPPRPARDALRAAGSFV